LKTSKWLVYFALGIFAISGRAAFADRHGDHHDNGHWRDRDKDRDRDDDDDRQGRGFAEHDRDAIRDWYSANYRNLPPGLAKRDRLPPGIEKQLVIRGTFPPGLEKRVYAVPVDLDRQLPPPPPDCERVVIGGHIVLRTRSTNIIVDIFHLE